MTKNYYKKEGNEYGGNLHLVLDDGNIDKHHILFCLNECKKDKDGDGINICNILLKMNKSELKNTIQYLWRIK